MRIKTIAGLAFAGAAVAAVGVAGAAHAGDDTRSDQVRIVYEDQGTAGAAGDPRDCPEKNGGGTPSPGEGESSGGGSQPPSQPSEAAL
jgi:hypothetical protein